MTTFRVRPSIGFARVGNSDEYNLAPETMAALPLPDESQENELSPGTSAAFRSASTGRRSPATTSATAAAG